MSAGSKVESRVNTVTTEDAVSMLEEMINPEVERLDWCKTTTGTINGEVVTLIDTPLGWLKV